MSSGNSEGFVTIVLKHTPCLIHTSQDYMGGGASKGFFTNVRYMFDLRDVVDDVGLVGGACVLANVCISGSVVTTCATCSV